MYQALLKKDVLILGCGNPLFGDDGFGPAVIEQIEKNYLLPSNVGVLNAGTSIRDLLFDLLLLEETPGTIIIVDAVDHESNLPGDISVFDKKLPYHLSLHLKQVPALSLGFQLLPSLSP